MSGGASGVQERKKHARLRVTSSVSFAIIFLAFALVVDRGIFGGPNTRSIDYKNLEASSVGFGFESTDLHLQQSQCY